jgi:hypothetical protein
MAIRFCFLSWDLQMQMVPQWTAHLAHCMLQSSSLDWVMKKVAVFVCHLNLLKKSLWN